jgi:hypothetical protein
MPGRACGLSTTQNQRCLPLVVCLSAAVGFGMSFKVAPGVRVRASSRGVRTSIGPRAARVHVGGGRTTISTGAGPVTAWTSAGSRRRTTYGRSGSNVSLAALQRQSAAAQRAEAIQSVMQLEHSLLTLHIEDFAQAACPVLPEPPKPDVAPFVAARKKQALEGISLFSFSKRKQARQWAHEHGQHDAENRWRQDLAEHAEQQAELAEEWARLMAHDEQAVHAALERAFEDNQSPAACIDVGKDGNVRFTTIVIIYGPVDLVPERQPAITPTGRPTLHKRTKTDRNNFYVRALGSTVLATVKEGFAVAPSVTEFRVVVLKKDPHAPSPAAYVEWIYAARFPRNWTGSLPWQSLNPGQALLMAPDARMERRGAAANIVGLPVADEPGLSRIVDTVRAAVE